MKYEISAKCVDKRRKVARTIMIGEGFMMMLMVQAGGVSMLIDDREASSHYFKSIKLDVLCKFDNNSNPLDVILKNLPSFIIISRSLSHLIYASAFLKLRLAL